MPSLMTSLIKDLSFQNNSLQILMKDLSEPEKAKLNKYAKALLMCDNRKAAAIGDYCKTILKKDIVPTTQPNAR